MNAFKPDQSVADANASAGAWDDPDEVARANAEGERDDLLADADLEWSFALAQEPGDFHGSVSDPHTALWREVGALGRAGAASRSGEKNDDELAAAALAAHRQIGGALREAKSPRIFARRGAWWWASVGAMAAGVTFFVNAGPSLQGVPLVGRFGEVLSQLAVRGHAPDHETNVAVPRVMERATAVTSPESDENRAKPGIVVVPEVAAQPVDPGAIAPDSADSLPESPSLPSPTTRPRAAIAPVSADALLQEAQRARAAGQDREAAAVYRKLVRLHPRSAEAKLVLVSLGRMELQGGSARAALRRFDEYLQQAGDGPLAQEAREGRIRALAEMGRRDDERAAIHDFLARYPGSSLRARLQQRLSDVEQKP